MQRVLQDPVEYVLSEYPELATLLAARCQYWVESVSEFAGRLQKDRDRIEAVAEQWRGEDDIGELVDVQVSLSDPHRRGRTVVIATFESGFQIVYKPRPVDIDLAFHAFAEWVHDESGPSLRVPRTLSRGAYGWAEYIASAPLSVSPQTYYQRAGALLCVMYVLRGKDFHHENIVATATHPVPIDLEVLCAPKPPYTSVSNLRTKSSSEEETVLSTGLLSGWRNVQGVPWDLGGFTPIGKGARQRMASWSEESSPDVSESSARVQALPSFKNIPKGESGDEMLKAHADDFMGGFTEAYRFFMSHRDTLLDADGPLSVFQGAQTRFLFRQTLVYGNFRAQSSSPTLLRDKDARDLELDLLFRPLLRQGMPRADWAPIIHAEKAAMAFHDVPVFDHDVDGVDLHTPTDTVSEYFDKSGLERVYEQIGRLSEEDLKWQLSLTQATIHGSKTDGMTDIPLRQRAAGNPGVRSPQRSSYREVERISAILHGGIAKMPNGEHQWATITLSPQTMRLHTTTPSDTLHSGHAGVALFLACHGSLHDNPASLLGAETLFDRLMERGQWTPSQQLHGGTEGLGSMIYSATEAADMLDHPEWLSKLVIMTESIDATAVQSDEMLDVIAGSAGTVLSLLNLHDATGSTSVIERAIACGDHLLQNRFAHGSHYVWRGMEGNADIGFAHGNAGIGFALDRLARTTGHGRFADAARETWDYVWSRYDDEAMAWIEIEDLGGTPRRFGPDGEADYEALAGDTWCRGNTGVLLALFLADTDRATERIDARIFDRILGMETELRDHVCCGAYGRISAVLNIARHLGDTDLERRAAEQAQKIAPSSDRSYTPQYGVGYFDPGLYTGLSGIGMTHLYIAHPESAPSILTWS